MDQKQGVKEPKKNIDYPHKVSNQIDNKVKIIIAFFLGAILAGVTLLFALPILSKYVNQLLIGFVVIIAILAILALLFTIYKEFFFKLFFGISKADVKEVNNAATSLVKNITNKKLEAASQDFDVVSKKGTAWYAWLSYRRWVVTVFYTLFLAFAGLLGSVLLYNQNQLLERQNEKIDAQIELEESSRRGNLIVMMSNIMDKVDDELKEDWNGDSIRNLSPQLIGRISALSRSFRPYRFWQDSMLIENPISPERGQLLIALANSELDSLTYKSIYQKSDFKYSYLVRADLGKIYLKHIHLGWSNLEYANLAYSKLDDVNLAFANLDHTNFYNTYIPDDTYFLKTNLSTAYFDKSRMSVNWFEQLKKWNVIGIDSLRQQYRQVNMPDKKMKLIYRRGIRKTK